MEVIVPVNMDNRVLASSLTEVNPPAWQAGKTCAVGDVVTYDGWLWLAQKAHTGKYPDREPEFWLRVCAAAPDAWNVAATYAVGNTVRHDRRVWRSIKADNRAFVPGTAPEWWESIGPVNSWAAFDSMINTKAAAVESITFELDFSACNALALFGLEGTEVTATVTDSQGAVVVTRVWLLSGEDAHDWIEYFFGQKTPREEILDNSFPFMAYSRITVTVASPGGIARVGHVAMGRAKFLGKTQYGAETGISDYSRKATDAFGNTYLSVGNWAKTTRLDLHVMNDSYDDVYRTLAKLRATPTVFLGDNSDKGLDALTVWGFVRDFRMVVSGPTASQCSLEIQGLV